MFSAINQVDNESFDVVWDLGRRCTYACTYCGPHHSNKTSPNASLSVLKHTLDGIVEYTNLYNKYRSTPKETTLAFTGGEPTINPNFFEFIEYCKEYYPHLKTNITTNGCYNYKKCKQIIDNIGSCTLSYHAEATDAEKKLVKDNILTMLKEGYNFRINLMFHKDYFDECIDMALWFDELGIKYIPRIIGDSNNPKDVEDGTAHIYTDKQLQWLKNYWSRGKKEKINKNAKSCEMAQNIGRPCCAGRKLNLFVDEGWTEGSFVPSNNFKGWNCMINWDFLFINSELNGVWHHQTCQVNMNGEIGPIGKASDFDKINKNLKNTLESGKVPFIKCPKNYCGCGLCSPKALNTDISLDIFYKNTKNLEPVLQDEVKDISKNKTIFRMFKEK
jgi:MoaA/NifB/PqqE/SkfB family radical SAM enzyme